MQRLIVSLLRLMVILLMSHRQPLLHELFATLGIDTDAHWITGWCGVVAENLPHLVEQPNCEIQKILGWKSRMARSCG